MRLFNIGNECCLILNQLQDQKIERNEMQIGIFDRVVVEFDIPSSLFVWLRFALVKCQLLRVPIISGLYTFVSNART